MKKRFMHTIRVFPLSAIMLVVIFSWCAPGQSQEILKQFSAPGPEARGLAWDGQYLWCADGSTGKIYQLDPGDGHAIFSFDFTLDLQFGGLAWSPDGYIWISDFRGGQSWYYKVDPSTAEIDTFFHCPGG